MASNDTNSWDEVPDERLRRRWQQTFADFEVSSGASLNRRVLSQLPTPHRRRPVGWLAGGILLLLLSIGLVYTNHVEEHIRLERRKAVTIRKSASGQPLKVSRRENGRMVKLHPATQSMRAGSSPTERQPIISSTGLTGMSENTAVDAITSRSATHRDVMHSRPVENSKKSITSVRQPVFKSVRVTGLHSSNPSIAREARARQKAERPATEQFTVNGNQLVPAYGIPISQPITGVSSVGWNLLASQKIALTSLSQLPNQLPVGKQSTEQPFSVNVIQQRWQWFVDVLPMSSFQLMSVAPTSMDYLSQVGSPAAFSPATWGYQVNGGVRFRHWRAYLTAGQLRRWAYYTVNENRYRLKATPADPYQLVRDTYTVTEDVALPMLGIGLSQERLLAKGRYAIEAGGQASYLPTTNQTLMGLRGSIGRRWPISRTMGLQAGLTVEYGLTRLLNEQQQLAIHPFVVGVGVRIQPRLGQ